MYPTLIIIVCAMDKSLNEKAAMYQSGNMSIVFADVAQSRQRSTVLETLSRSESSRYEAAPEVDISKDQGGDTTFAGSLPQMGDVRDGARAH